MTSIDGSTALVTGGQRGLGRAFVEELLRRGATKVYATARRPEDRAHPPRRLTIPVGDPRIVPLPLEVTDPDSVAAVAARTTDVNIVINNAGLLRPAPLLRAEIADVVATFDTNVFGPLRIAQAFAPILRANGGGALVDIHSVLSWGAGFAAYGASKAAIWSLTNSLRIELAGQGTQVVGVHLGFADTDMVRNLTIDKISPQAVAEAVADGLEKGENEVLVDEVTRQVKAALSGPVENLALSLRG